MARIVCQVLHRPNRVTFVWSEGSAFFEPYHLQGQEFESFYEAAYTARQHLARLGQGADGQAAADLAKAGHELFKAIFRHSAGDPNTRQIQTWLHDLRDQNVINTLDFLGDIPGRIPWNVVFDDVPAAEALRSGDPQGLRPFWGCRYALGAGKRVNPLRLASVLDSPNILIAADLALLDKLPADRKNVLMDLAIEQELTILDTGAALRSKLRKEAPDILYLFAALEAGGLRLGTDKVSIQELKELLTHAEEGNADPVIFLQACGQETQLDSWERFVQSAVNALSGVIMSEVPVAPALADALGIKALSGFLKNQGLGLAVSETRRDAGVAGLVYSAFCPTHVKIAGDDNIDPEITGPEPLPLPEYPYRPLAPFDSEDRGLFTGREDDTVNCAGLVDEAATPALILHGEAGVGKTSFLRAGLIPHLETEAVGFLALRDRTPEDGIQGESDYPIVALRPGIDLTGQIAEALSVFCAQPYHFTTPAGKRVEVDLPGLFAAGCQGPTDTGVAAGLPPNSSPETAATPTERLCPECGKLMVLRMSKFGAFWGCSGYPECKTSIKFDAEDKPVLASKLTDARQLEQNGAEAPAADLVKMLGHHPHRLAGLLDALTSRLPFDLVLAVEQGEDLVLQDAEGAKRRRARAIALLREIVRSPARCKWILSVRTDYFGRLMECFSSGHERWRHYYLKELDEDQLLQALLLPTSAEPVPYSSEIPRQKYQFNYEDGLPPTIIKDIQRAADEKQGSAVAILQAVGAYHYDRLENDAGAVVKRSAQKALSKSNLALTRYLDEKMVELSISPSDRQELKKVLSHLYQRHGDGTVTRALVPASELAEGWKSTTPLEAVVDAAAEAGLVEVNQAQLDGQREDFLSLPQDALARTVSWGDEDKKQAAFGRTRILDTLWIMIPLAFLAAALTFHFTRVAYRAAAKETNQADEETVNKLATLQELVEMQRWEVYLGQLLRAQQAWNTDNPQLARKLMVAPQMTAQPDLRDFEWYYLWNKFRGSGVEATGQKGPITSVAISGEGTVGASASQDGTVKLWNLIKQEELATLKGHAGAVLAVAFAPDGKSVASAGADKIVRIWDMPATQAKPAVIAKDRKTLTGHECEVRALAFGSAGLVSGGADKQVILWDLATGKPAKVFKDHRAAIQAVAESATGLFASADAEGVILIHDGVKTLQTIKTPGSINALAFAPDGKTLAAGGTEKQQGASRGLIHIWDPITGKEVGAPFIHSSEVLGLTYLPQSKLLASGGKDNLVRVWDPETGRQVSAYKGHGDWVVSLAAAVKGKTLLSGSRDGSIKTWNALPPDVIQAHDGPAQAVVFALENKLIVSGGKDGTVKFWDQATGQLVGQLTGLGNVTSLASSPGIKAPLVAAGTGNDKKGEVRWWEVTMDAKQGFKTKELPALTGHSGMVTCLAFSPDGRHLASGSVDKTAILWDILAGKAKYTLAGHTSAVRCLAFSGDKDSSLCTGDADGWLRSWDVNEGKEYRKPVQVDNGAVNAVTFFFGDIGFVTGGADGNTKFWIWNPDVEPKVYRLQHANTQPVTSLAMSPSRRFLATGSLDETVKLFNVRIEFEARQAHPTKFFGEERFTFPSLGTPVRALAVSRDSMVLAGAGDDGTLRLWRAAEKKGLPKEEEEKPGKKD